MENNKNEKKHNKLAGWFLGLPKWGKILLIAGSAAGVATAVTVPIVVVNSNKGGSTTTVTEAEFKNGLSSLKSASVGDTHDNRNYTETYNGSYSYDEEEGEGEEKTTVHVESAIEGNILHEIDFLSGNMKITTTKKGQTETDNNTMKSNYIGNAVYHEITTEQEAGGEEELKIKLTTSGESDYLGWIANADYDYKSLTYNNGTYSGTFSVAAGGKGDVVVLPLSFTFNKDKKVSQVKISGKVDFMGTVVDTNITIGVSNYGSTSTGLKQEDFKRYEFNYSSGTLSEDLESDFSKAKVIVVHSTADIIKTKTLSLVGTTKNPCFDEIFSNGTELKGFSSGTDTVKLSEISSATPVGNDLYIVTDDTTDPVGDVTFNIN